MILIALLRVVIDEFLHAGLDESDLDEDLVGGGGPGEGFRVLVPGVDVVADLFDQDVDARERAAADGVPFRNSSLLVKPRICTR